MSLQTDLVEYEVRKSPHSSLTCPLSDRLAFL